MGAKKTGSPKSRDISATRLSPGDPIGFPPHPRGWFSIIVYHHLIYTEFRLVTLVGINVRLYQALQLDRDGSPPVSYLEHKKAGASYRLCDISATRLSR